MDRWKNWFLGCLLGMAWVCGAGAAAPLTWTTDALPPLPERLTDHAVGTHQDALLVAGGRTLGGEASDRIYALLPGAKAWRDVGSLPIALLGCAAASDASGMYLLGGTKPIGGDELPFDGLLRVVYREGRAVVEPLAVGAPVPLLVPNAAIYKGALYVAGPRSGDTGESTTLLYALNLAQPETGWQRTNQIPGALRPGITLAAARDGVYLLGTGAAPLHYAPGAGWRRLAGAGQAFAGSPAVAVGPAHLLVLGQPAPEGGAAQPTIMGYERITNTWAALGEVPEVRTGVQAVAWDGKVALPGGTTRDADGNRVVQGSVLLGTPHTRANGFGWLDYLAIIAYFGAMLGIGMYFSRRETSTENFFLGGRAIPWWAAGLSIFGTSISSITYLAIPAKAYATDWVFLVGNMTILLIAPLITWVYIPAFRRAPITTAYEYLETRFNLAIRLYGSLVFVMFQVGRIAIVLYLPALVLSASTGLSMEFSIVAMGIITTIYTVMGGAEAVIWTDVIQSFVLVGGALLALFIAVYSLDGGWSALSAMAASEGKTHWFNFATDYTTPAIWVCVLGNAFAMFYPSTADQTIVQRYLSTASHKAAARAVWTNALLTVPVSFLFFGLGTALWAYFKTRPEQLDPTLPTDAILPVFVMETFPVGLRSTLIAGVFAAAMSSLSASMNSLAAVAVNDYYRRFVPDLPEARALYAAKMLTLLIGLFGTGMALVIAWLEVPSLFDQWLRWLGLIGGGLAGIVALGVFTRRGHGRGAVVGALASAAAVAWVQATPAHFFLHGMVGFLSALIVGYVASWVIPSGKRARA